MARGKDQVLAGTLVDETTEVSLEQVSVFCSVRRERIVALVRGGRFAARDDAGAAGRSINGGSPATA